MKEEELTERARMIYDTVFPILDDLEELLPALDEGIDPVGVLCFAAVMGYNLALRDIRRGLSPTNPHRYD